MGNIAGMPAIDSMVIGGRTFVNFSRLIVLMASTQTTTGKGTFRAPGTNAGYQVTAGKTFYIVAYKFFSGNAAAPLSKIYSATNDLGFDSSGSITGGTQLIPPSSATAGAQGFSTSAAAGATCEAAFPDGAIAVAATRYITVDHQTSGAGGLHILIGYEV